MPRSTALKAVQTHFTNEQIVSAATGRWGEVASEVKLAEPYVIEKADGGKITIAPLTRRRRKALKAAQAAYLLSGAKLAEAENNNTSDQGTITRIQLLLDQAEEAYDKALFGDDVYKEVHEYFEDLQEEFWNAMYQDVHDKLVNRVEPPEDVCSKCGHQLEREEGEEGKDESSSTSSTATGTK